MRVISLFSQCARVAVLCLFSLFNIPSAMAATIEPFDDPLMGCDIRISGVIREGDAERLKEVLDGRRGAVAGYVGSEGEAKVGNVCFDSRGGSFVEAIRLARIIKGSGLGTAVGENAVCESACSLAFMAGEHSCLEAQ